jgi:hypothetical protein
VSATSTSTTTESERVRDAGRAHHEQQQDVRATPPDAISGETDRDRDQGVAGEDRREHEPDLAVGEAAVGERGAQDHAREPVPERAQGLDREDDPKVVLERDRGIHGRRPRQIIPSCRPVPES